MISEEGREDYYVDAKGKAGEKNSIPKYHIKIYICYEITVMFFINL